MMEIKKIIGINVDEDAVIADIGGGDYACIGLGGYVKLADNYETFLKWDDFYDTDVKKIDDKTAKRFYDAFKNPETVYDVRGFGKKGFKK